MIKLTILEYEETSGVARIFLWGGREADKFSLSGDLP